VVASHEHNHTSNLSYMGVTSQVLDYNTLSNGFGIGVMRVDEMSLPWHLSNYLLALKIGLGNGRDIEVSLMY
jgi:hypothetical protein